MNVLVSSAIVIQHAIPHKLTVFTAPSANPFFSHQYKIP
jgi:hypothetical protein